MKYTIAGLQQSKLVELGLDIADAYILRWVIDFWHSGRMTKVLFEYEEYIWIKYQKVIDELPIMGIKSRRSIENRFKKYVSCGLMKHYTLKEGGTYSCYMFTDMYTYLIDYPSNSNDDPTSVDLLPPTSVDLLPKDSSTNINSSTNNSKPPKAEIKRKYGEYDNVLLTDKELEKLEDKFKSDMEPWINKLSFGIALKGYKYKSHYLAILKWDRDDKKKDQTNKSPVTDLQAMAERTKKKMEDME